MRQSPLSLRSSVLLFVLLPLLAVLVGLGIWGLREFEQQLSAQAQREIELVARAIRLPIADAMERDDPAAVQQALDSVFQIDRVIGVYVYDQGGELIATTGARGPSLERRRDARAITAAGSQGAFDERRGREVFSFFLTLHDLSARPIGLLQVTRDVADLGLFLTRMQRAGGAALLGLTLVLVLVVSVGHHRAVGRHARALVAAMRPVDAAARGHRVPVAGPAELRRLSVGINQMIARWEHSQQRLARQRQLQASLKEQLRQSEKLAAIGELAAGVAHELGTPLGVIAGRAQRAARQAPGDSRLAAELQAILAELGRVERIVRQLLDFARRNPPQRRRLDLPRLLAGLLVRYREHAEARGLQLAVVAADGGEPRLLADQARLEQALGNLLDNAIQAARRQVMLRWRVHDGRLEIAVADDGPGCGDADIERLCTPFYTTKPSGEGTGLGLAIARAAIEEQGGNLGLTAAPAGGACFVVCLPAADPRLEPAGDPSTAPVSSTASRSAPRS
ncbi:MAG: two-component sensor histidine kinase [Chromatiaceae bacterium]|nr:MAG: two-component sensor histidine kinase [Chromatiaceae bacterium]